MASMLEHCTWAYNEADRLAGLYPYCFGGGHPSPKAIWQQVNSNGVVVLAPGPDCSGWVSHHAWHGGILGTPASVSAQVALDTHAFEAWGQAGRGQYLTVWVIDTASLEHEQLPDPVAFDLRDVAAEGLAQHHCFLEFHIPGKPHRWSAANQTGTIAGWFDAWGGWDPSTAGYRPRSPLL